MRPTITFVLVVCAALLMPSADLRAARVKDITRLEGAQDNMVSGYGIVVGLAGTGDKGKFLPMVRSLSNEMKIFGHFVTEMKELTDVTSVALVKVAAELPPFHSKGDRIDVTVASVGPASSLNGGRLLVSFLGGPNLKYDPDEPVRVVARGPVSATGSVPTTGRVTNGGTIVCPFESDEIVNNAKIAFLLAEAHADWNTAEDIARAINEDYIGIQVSLAREYEQAGGEAKELSRIAWATSANRVEVVIPEEYLNKVPSFIGRCQQVLVADPQMEARVVIDEATGTVVLTGNVEIAPVLIAHKNLRIAVRQQPAAETTSVGSIPEPPVAGSQLEQLVNVLRRLNVAPGDLIEIFKKLDTAGALNAKMVIR